MSILDKLLNKCEQDGVLKEEEEDIIRFGIESLINLVICLGILLCIGWIFGSLLSGIFFFAFFLPLRKFAGGYHSNTEVGCIISSIIILLLVFSTLFLGRWNIAVYLIISVLCNILFFFMVPVENKNKLLDKLEKEVYRKKTWKVLTYENLCVLFSYYMNLYFIIRITAMVYVTVGILLIWGRLDNLKMIGR
ncbi:hypothetical protein DXB01_06285 [Clostridium sp. OF10-22XD]|jgi:accessory gene regulator B|nr:hypothetical protein DXB01_06285 [Clostridium sp. OF10-22XD]